MESEWRSFGFSDDVFELRGDKVGSRPDSGLVINMNSRIMNVGVYDGGSYRWVPVTPEQALDFATALTYYALELKPELKE